MVGLIKYEAVRALGAALSLAGLAACASVPAPVGSSFPGLAPAPEREPLDPNAPPRVVDSAARLQCVPYARRASGIEIYGDANTWWRQAEGRYPRSSLPAAGSVLVLRGYHNPNRGHVAVVTEVVSPRVIRVDQANWLNGGEITVDVPVMDVSPGNDWSEVRVWYIPTGSWGARTYEAEGFIHAFAMAEVLS